MTSPVICLNMIVKNEVAVLPRCLASLIPCLGYWVICDTGSTDGTPELVQEILGGAGIPGELHRFPFTTFEASRNHALDRCRDSAARFDYILLADADMELVVEDPGFRSRLAGEVYSVRQETGISYYNTRLIRRSLPARYVGVTHEYLSTPEPAVRFDGIWFRDYADGANRPEKITRDLALLRQGLRDEPGNVRYMFYLAQTLRDAHQWDEAARWYRARAQADSGSEEGWYAQYQLALCLWRMGDGPGFLEAARAAHQRRPWRAEPVRQAAAYYRQAGQPELAARAALIGAAIPYPQSDGLFIEPEPYRSGCLEELARTALFTSDPALRDQGRRACFDLAVSRSASSGARQIARNLLPAYARSAGELFGPPPVVRRLTPKREGLVPCNPSIAGAGGPGGAGGPLHCVIRMVNYRTDGRYFMGLGESGIQTKNLLVRLDQNLEVTGCTPLTDRSSEPVRHPGARIRGLEDCRLFQWRESWWCVATARDRNPREMAEIVLARLEADGSIEFVQLLPGPDPDRHEKNWVPLVRNDELFLLYRTDPTVILRVPGPGRAPVEVSRSAPEPEVEHLRGGSQAIWCRDRWLYLTHEVTVNSAGQRIYLHRLVALNPALRVIALSDPFFFQGRGIEFAAGLAWDAAGDRLIVSYGRGDCEAWLASWPVDSMMGALR